MMCDEPCSLNRSQGTHVALSQLVLSVIVLKFARAEQWQPFVRNPRWWPERCHDAGMQVFLASLLSFILHFLRQSMCDSVMDSGVNSCGT